MYRLGLLNISLIFINFFLFMFLCITGLWNALTSMDLHDDGDDLLRVDSCSDSFCDFR